MRSTMDISLLPRSSIDSNSPTRTFLWSGSKDDPLPLASSLSLRMRCPVAELGRGMAEPGDGGAPEAAKEDRRRFNDISSCGEDDGIFGLSLDELLAGAWITRGGVDGSDCVGVM